MGFLLRVKIAVLSVSAFLLPCSFHTTRSSWPLYWLCHPILLIGKKKYFQIFFNIHRKAVYGGNFWAIFSGVRTHIISILDVQYVVTQCYNRVPSYFMQSISMTSLYFNLN